MKIPIPTVFTHRVKNTEFARFNGIAGDRAYIEGNSHEDPDAKVFVLVHDGIVGPFPIRICELELLDIPTSN